MLNYANLNDMEFEALCKDVMEKMLGVSLRRFGPGRDHGVDLTDDVSTKTIVVQVKHYRNSTTDQLVRSLKNELPKATELAPQQYYICCSRELSADNINALYQHFQAYMASDRHIVTLIEIDDFLKQEANRDILKKHFKLWLDSTGILEELFNDDIFVDCEALLSDVDELQKLFVRTSAFDKALKVLESNQPLCIIGDPGVGKSITSKMLVLHYAALGYRVRYTTDVTDLKSLKKALRDDTAAKEVILLDDCFGQAYFEMKSSQSSELVALIKYVKLHPNKVLILNSRVTIFQEARERQQELVRCMDRKDFRVHVLDMNNLSGEEKAKILYNHLAFSGIPDEYFENIRIDKRYRHIIFHRNYNPRIIEFVCNPNRYTKIPSSQFFEYIMKQLNNPQEIWANEYDDRLQPADRILLQTIYSMTTATVKADLVRRCFERRIAGIPTIDKTLDQYNRSLMRLSEGFIRILDNRGTQELSMLNPSVNDFMNKRLCKGTLEHEELVRSICTAEQLRLLSTEDRVLFIINLLQTDRIDDFLFSSPLRKKIIIGRSIISAGVCIEKYRFQLTEYLQEDINSDFPYRSLFPIESLSLLNLLLPEIWNYYDIESFLFRSNHLSVFLGLLSFKASVKFIGKLDTLVCANRPGSYIQQVEQYLEYMLDDIRHVATDDYSSYFDIENIINCGTHRDVNGTYIDEQWMVSEIEYCVKKAAFREIHSLLTFLPAPFHLFYNNFTISSISVVDSDFWLSAYLDESDYDYSDDDFDSDSYSIIDAIFQR